MIIDLALDDRVVISSSLDMAIQELDLLFNTECTELIGNPYFGVSLDQFLWTLTPTTSSLKKYLSDKLAKLHFLNMFKYNLNVEYEKSEEWNSAYNVTVQIWTDRDDSSKTIKREYKFK